MADIVILTIIIIMALWGWKSGFVKSVFHLGYYIISAIAASFLYPVLSKVLMNSKLYGFIHDKIIMPRLSVSSGQITLPSLLQQAVDAGISRTKENLANSFTEMIINIICFIAMFLLVRLGLRLLVNVLDSVAKLPLLNVVNKFGGIAVGVLNGFAVVYILLAFATVFMSEGLFDFISSSNYAIKMYNDNILLKLLFG